MKEGRREGLVVPRRFARLLCAVAEKGRSRRNRAYTSFRPGARPIRWPRCSREATASGPVRPRRRTAWCCWTRSSTCRATPTRALQQSLPLSPTTSKVRAAIWSLAIGVLAVALAALLSRVVPMPGALLVLLLAVCCGAVSLGAALIAEIPVRVGAGGGAFPAALVAPVLGLPSRRRRPLRGRAPGPRRPPLAPARRPPGRADPPRGRGLARGARWLRLVRRRLTRDTLEASAAPRRP